MDTISTLAEMTEYKFILWIVGISAGALFMIIWTVCETIESVSKSRSRERFRREVTAYIAEGSMTPEEGEGLLKAGNTRSIGQAIHEAING